MIPSSWKYGAMAFGVLLLLGIIGGGWLHYDGLVKANGVLQADVAKLQSAFDTQKLATEQAVVTTNRWAEASERAARTVEEMSQTQREAAMELRRLNDVFASHNLGSLGSAKPVLVERAVNRGTADAISLLQRSTDPGGSSEARSSVAPASRTVAAPRPGAPAARPVESDYIGKDPGG